MEASTARIETGIGTEQDLLAGMLEGFRFSVCETVEQAEAALELRDGVYNGSSGYSVPVPDEYDVRSWLLIAEDTTTGKVVGTMRLTPRSGGTLESEEYFELPAALRTPGAIELNRFAILPEYRKGKTFIPVVSFGLFKLVHEFLASIGAEHMVVSSKAERMWTYEWLGFQRTGQVAHYEKLNGAEHELLAYDFQARGETLAEHPFRDLFFNVDYDEVMVPSHAPRLGLAADTRLAAAQALRQAA
jgi:N-acyl-L-homoserine lactone synthetase